MTDDDSKSIIFPPGEKEEEEENKDLAGAEAEHPPEAWLCGNSQFQAYKCLHE